MEVAKMVVGIFKCQPTIAIEISRRTRGELTFTSPALEIFIEFVFGLTITHEVMGMSQGTSHCDKIGNEPSFQTMVAVPR
jgi:hypothetical protein